MLCGSDVFTGSEIWQLYRSFAIDEHENLLDEEADSEADMFSQRLVESKKRWIKLYHRQLSLPLVGNEEVLREFEANLSSYCVESDMALVQPAELEKKVLAATEAREARLMYEMHILSDKTTQQDASSSNAGLDASTDSGKDAEARAAFWAGYVNFEVKQKNMSRAQRVYERALLDCAMTTSTSTSSLSLSSASSSQQLRAVAKLWLGFVEFALCSLQSWDLVARTAARALKHPACRSALFLWKLRLCSLEATGAGPTVFQAEVQLLVQTAGLANVGEYLDVYYMHCDYLKRRLLKAVAACRGDESGSGSKSNAADIAAADAVGPQPRPAGGNAEHGAALSELHQLLETALGTVCTFLTSYCPSWIEGWCRYCNYATYLQEEVLMEASSLLSSKPSSSKIGSSKTTAEDLWVYWESTSKLFPNSFLFWSEYIQARGKARTGVSGGSNVEAKNSSNSSSSSFKTFAKLFHNRKIDVPIEQVISCWMTHTLQYGTDSERKDMFVSVFPRAKTVFLDSLQQMEHLATGAAASNAVSTPAAAVDLSPSSENCAPEPTLNRKEKRKLAQSGGSGSDAFSQDAAQPTASALKKVKFEEPSRSVAATAAPSSVSAGMDVVSTDQTADSSSNNTVAVPRSENIIVVSNFPFTATLDSIRPMVLGKCASAWDVDDDDDEEEDEDDKVFNPRATSSASAHNRSSSSSSSSAAAATAAAKTQTSAALTQSQESQSQSQSPPQPVSLELVLSKTGKSRGMVELHFAPDTAAQHGAYLRRIVAALYKYEYNGRTLYSEMKALPPVEATATATATARALKDAEEGGYSQVKKDKKKARPAGADPVEAQRQAGSLAAPHLTTVFVSQLSPEVTSGALQSHFSACGEVLAAKVAVDKKTKASKVGILLCFMFIYVNNTLVDHCVFQCLQCTALVQFSSSEGRSKAIEMMDKSSFHGAEMKVIPSRFSLIPVADATIVTSVAARSLNGGNVAKTENEVAANVKAVQNKDSADTLKEKEEKAKSAMKK
jgi:hypothetical protein